MEKKKTNGSQPATQHDLEIWGGELTRRINGVETGLGEVVTRLDGVETRLDGVESRLDGVETRLDGVETRLEKVEGKIDGLDSKLDQAVKEIVDHIDAVVEVRIQDLRGASREEIAFMKQKEANFERRISKIEKKVFAA